VLALTSEPLEGRMREKTTVSKTGIDVIGPRTPDIG
jgi:hypothetical protein